MSSHRRDLLVIFYYSVSCIYSGGLLCPPCLNGLTCATHGDCVSNYCDDGACVYNAASQVTIVLTVAVVLLSLVLM